MPGLPAERAILTPIILPARKNPLSFAGVSGLKPREQPATLRFQPSPPTDPDCSWWETQSLRRYSYILACASGLTAHGATALAQDTETPLFLGTLPVLSTHDWDAYDGAADRAESVYIGPEELERQDPQTLKEVFASDATVQVGGAVPASQKVYVNGIEETNLAVTVDGARQNQKLFHHSSTNLIDPGLLKAVRVDPGVTAADSGPGAIAGAIAYETVDVDDLLAPDETAGGFATARYGFNGDTFVGGLAGYGRRDGFEGLAYVRYGDGDNYDDGDGDEVPGTGTDLTSFLAKGAYESETGHRFEISAMQTQDDADRPYRANIGSLIGRDEPEVREYDLTTRNVVLTYEATRATGIWQPTAQIAWSESTTDVPDPWGSEGTGEGWNGKVENRFGLGDLGSINAGVDFYSEETSYEDPFTDELTEKATNWGLYGQARLTPIQPLRVSLGLRADQQRFEGVDGSKETNSGLSGNASGRLRHQRDVHRPGRLFQRVRRHRSRRALHLQSRLGSTTNSSRSVRKT